MREVRIPRRSPPAAIVTACCPHKGADHAATESGNLSPGVPCTIPDCRCQGWVSGCRSRGTAERVRDLQADGLDNREIRERLGISTSAASGPRRRRAVKPLPRGEVRFWPPAGVRVVSVSCPKCRFVGGVYTRPDYPPGYIHCPSPSQCGHVIEIAGREARVRDVC